MPEACVRVLRCRGGLVLLGQYDEILTVEKACEILRVGKNALYHMLVNKRLKGHGNGRVRRRPKRPISTNPPVPNGTGGFVMMRYAADVFGQSICHFRGKVIYRFDFSQNHCPQKLLYAHMAQNWAEYGSKMTDLGHFHLISTRFTMSHNLANQKKMDLVGETDKVHLII